MIRSPKPVGTLRGHTYTQEVIPLHVQIATYTIGEVSDRDFIEANREFAQVMSAVPGLRAKVWLKAPDGSAYGGIYLWEDQAAYEAFVASDLWASVKEDDALSDLESRDFSVMEALTRATQPGLEIVRTRL